MLGPAHLQRFVWFHPVGNTTPVCLTQTLPPDDDASILMLGCGDVRNVLFTVYSDLSTNERRLDFTCCDLECEVLARNVMLYTLLMLRSESSIEKKIFSIYYDIMLEEDTLIFLRWHATRLCFFAQSLQVWQSSSFSRYIRFMDSKTLENCRQMWEMYCTCPATATEFGDLQSSLRNTIATAQELQSCYMQDGKSYYGIKAFGPMADYVPEIMALRYAYYWHRGVTRISDPPSMSRVKGECVHMNPMFATRQSSLVMHHGTDPYRSMHLSTLFVPLTEDSPLKPVMSDDIDKLYDVAVSQFKEYAEAFRKKIRNITIRVVNAEATAFCHSLHCSASFGNGHNSGWYRSTWGFEPLVLDNVSSDDPMTFHVIDTSSLADHVGCLNLISTASPLLKETHTSTLRVETAIIRDGEGPECGVDILSGHFVAVSSIFGLGCMHYWTQNGNTPVFQEKNLQDLPKSVFHGQLIYCRTAIEWRHMGAGNKIRMEERELARIMGMMYVEMFGDENTQSRAPRRHRHRQYSRASFVAAVGAVRKAVQVSDWNVVVEELLALIRQDCAVDFRYKEDLFLHLHLQGVHTATRYTGFISHINETQEGLLSQWSHIPASICMTMVVPRKKLEFLADNFSPASLVAQVYLSRPNRNTDSTYDCFQSVQLAFGRVLTAGTRYTETYTVTVHSDNNCRDWEGTSDLVVSAMIPTWKLLEHRHLDFQTGFSLRDVGDADGTLRKQLGEGLVIFSDNLNGNSIFLTRHRPNIPDPMWFSSLSARAASYRNPPVQFQPYYTPWLISNSNEGRVFLVCPSTLRLDLSNKTIVLDCAVAHLNKHSLPYLRPWLDGTEPCYFKQLFVSDDELLMWKHTIPAFVERCRTWSHSESCEYLSLPQIPLSTENMEPGIFCSCAYAHAFSDSSSSSSSNNDTITYDIGNSQLFSCLTPRHAVRAALTLPFPTAFGPASLDTDVSVWAAHILPQKRRRPREGQVKDTRWCRIITREKCDRRATELAGQAVEPVQLQGAFSYTLAAGNLVVQFRDCDSLLDTKTVDLAREIYGNMVPACVNKGVIGPPPSLTVYLMDKAPGITYIEVPLKTLHCTSWQEQTVSDFARFFANSWTNRLAESYRSDHSLADLQGKMDLLSRQIPLRFTRVVSKLREELPILFTSTYPLVLNHGDLCEMNIIVNPEIGGITGVIDWAEAKILPFGMSLWGVQNMLGYMNSTGWHYHENSSRLEGLFWDTFYEKLGTISDDDKQAMKTAERVGLVLRYGFTWEDGTRERPVTEQDSSIRYLDAFLHRLED
ncbi:Tudor domain-containing protein 15 [Talaromyces islandicus]|uniref:Tudor domain-containing protein 15 n=1 Tax=Talaromyces islandicus TaxID=28573 RepID=A0A0U1LKQ9_TALIS|nr:Tudor domain-containing protein 15 [Talaromyces islandicus]